MGKKKKGGKEKGDKAGGGDKLPPPPNLEDQRQGAREALLTFKIHGKEETIGQFQEEAEVFRDRNYQQKEQNGHLKAEQANHYRTLICQAREHEEEMERSEKVEREEVEEALREKLMFAKYAMQDLLDLEARICDLDCQLEVGGAEVATWMRYKEVIQHEKAAYIAAMKEKMDGMAREEEQLQSELEVKLASAKQEIKERSKVMFEKQRELISSQLAETLDKDTLAEMSDNSWLRKETAVMQERLKRLQGEVDALELRNLRLMEKLCREQREDLERTREVYLTSLQCSRRSMVGGDGSPSGSGLPSLVVTRKSTAQEGPGGQLGQMELQLLWVEGLRASLAMPPETLHLPPIEEQRCSHTALPPRTSWPVTNTMLKSFV